MIELTTIEILKRLVMAIIFSGLIGLERETSNSNAGIKTHILVGVGATIVALIQVEAIEIVKDFGPDSRVGVDAVRLIAQVVSGIGFLGAGTIIVTKRNVFGLTTAASIWSVASIGLALGMGYYEIAILGSLLVVAVLVIFKRFLVISGSEYLLVKYIPDERVLSVIKKSFKELGLENETIRYSSSIFGHELVITHVFKVKFNKTTGFDEIVAVLSKINNIISVEQTNIG